MICYIIAKVNNYNAKRYDTPLKKFKHNFHFLFKKLVTFTISLKIFILIVDNKNIATLLFKLNKTKKNTKL